jgi:Flp pilus assembly protein TadG
MPFLAILAFGTIDIARAWSLRNRLTNAAREGSSLAQFFPQYLNGGCNGGRNIRSHVGAEDPSLVSQQGYTVTAQKKSPSGSSFTYTSYDNGPVDAVCLDPQTGGGALVTFDRANNDGVVVKVSADLEVMTPIVSSVVGDPLRITGSSEVVIQG